MTRFTRENKKAVSQHLLKSVMDCGDDGTFPELVKIMKDSRIPDPESLTNLSSSQIEGLEYQEDVGTVEQPRILTRQISVSLQNYLKWFIQWFHQVIVPRYGTRNLTVEQFLELKGDEFDEYRTSTKNVLIRRNDSGGVSGTNRPQNPERGAVSNTRPTINALEIFERDVEHDVSTYLTPESHLLFDTWNTDVPCQTTEHD